MTDLTADWPQLLQVALLGAVQGFTEFLPISSSAHLLLLHKLLDLPYYGKAFDLMLHLGSLAAVVYFLRREIVGACRGAKRFVLSGGCVWPENTEERMGAVVLIATVPTSCLGFLLDPWVESFLQGPLMLALMLAVFGVLLGMSDCRARRREMQENTRDSDIASLNSINWKVSLKLGLAQSLAFIPGVSRSGICLTAARSLGLTREFAVRLSMLMSVPVIAGAAVVKIASGALLALELPLPLIGLGIAVSALCSWLSLRLLCAAGRILLLAACYRVVLAAVIVMLLVFPK